MLKSSLIISLNLVFSLLYCQDYDFSKSIKLNNKTPRFKILGKNSKYIVAERKGSKTHYLDLYNTKLKRTTSRQIQFNKDEVSKRIWIQPNKSWIVYTKHLKDKTLVLAKKLDNKLNIKATPTVLDSIFERKDLIQQNFRTKFSLNEKILVTYLPIFSKGEIDYFKIKVYNTKLKEIQSIKIKDEFIKRGQYVSLLPMNDGSIVLIFKDKESTNKFKVFYKKPEEELIKHSIVIDNEVYKKLRVIVDNKTEELIFSGFRQYQNNKKKTSDAFFSFKLKLESGKKSKKLLEVYTKEFYKLLTGKENNKEKVTLQTFSVKKILPKQDGGFLVFAESFYENVETKSSPYILTPSVPNVFENNSYKIKSYNYNDIIIYSISNEMILESVNIIDKTQQSFDDKGGYSSFLIVNRQDKLNILFLDEISTESTLKNFTINPESKLEEDWVFYVSQNNVMPVMKMGLQVSPNEVLIPSFLNNSFSIIKVLFTD